MNFPGWHFSNGSRRVPVGVLCLLASLSVTGLWGGTADSSAQFHTLMINGGGRRQSNYQSHLLHVKQLRELLFKWGVQNSHITILSADGSDPGADLAVRDPQRERDFWRLTGTRLEKPLRNRIRFENSEISGATLEPATRESIRRWFETATGRLLPGDTLFLYVTDHGTKGKKDSLDNAITLWGRGEDLTVTELRELVAMLDPEVRVVALMSQCYSGAFADLMYASAGDDLPRGNICGFFLRLPTDVPTAVTRRTAIRTMWAIRFASSKPWARPPPLPKRTTGCWPATARQTSLSRHRTFIWKRS